MFARPVDPRFPIKAYFGSKNTRYNWSIDPQTHLWVPERCKDGFGMHCGTDFDCPSGTPVRAMVDGIITSARTAGPLDYHASSGLFVIQLVMDPGFDSWWAKYAHLRRVYVEHGQRINRGDIIGLSGIPYLHVDLMDLKRQWKAVPLEG